MLARSDRAAIGCLYAEGWRREDFDALIPNARDLTFAARGVCLRRDNESGGKEEKKAASDKA